MRDVTLTYGDKMIISDMDGESMVNYDMGDCALDEAVAKANELMDTYYLSKMIISSARTGKVLAIVQDPEPGEDDWDWTAVGDVDYYDIDDDVDESFYNPYIGCDYYE